MRTAGGIAMRRRARLAARRQAAREPRGRGGGLRRCARRPAQDPRLATTLVLGGWFLVEAVVLSLSKGIVHPYYVSALAPGAAAMAGAGAVAFVQLATGAAAELAARRDGR